MRTSNLTVYLNGTLPVSNKCHGIRGEQGSDQNRDKEFHGSEFFRQVNPSSLCSLAIDTRKVCVQLLFFEPMLVSVVLPLHELL